VLSKASWLKNKVVTWLVLRYIAHGVLFKRLDNIS